MSSLEFNFLARGTHTVLLVLRSTCTEPKNTPLCICVRGTFKSTTVSERASEWEIEWMNEWMEKIRIRCICCCCCCTRIISSWRMTQSYKQHQLWTLKNWTLLREIFGYTKHTRSIFWHFAISFRLCTQRLHSTTHARTHRERAH